MDIDTLCVHGSEDRSDATGSVTLPIYQTSIFAHPAVGESTGYDYSRVRNPTRDHLERLVAQLEHGADALAFASGMAAIACLVELFQIGDHLIVSGDLYGGSIRLFRTISEKNGLTFDYVDTSDISQVETHVRPDTKAIFIETPTNPMMRVTDIRAAAAIAKKHRLLLAVDNTFLTPYFQTPILLGADVVIHSGTKYLCGHNDTLAGFLIPATASLAEKLRAIYVTTGAYLSPFDSWLLIRGIKTLPIRMERQQQTAHSVADWMCRHPKIQKVFYVGLKTHPGYTMSSEQASGFGAMISFEVDSEKTAADLLENLRIIRFAESLGGTETLLTCPATQTHADVPAREREAMGINSRLLRLSIGLESANDIISDLTQALR